jgi:hypothetical protein
MILLFRIKLKSQTLEAMFLILGNFSQFPNESEGAPSFKMEKIILKLYFI